MKSLSRVVVLVRASLPVACLAVCASAGRASATDAGQWGGSSPEVQQWFRSLMQPEHPMVSCCGEADGFPVAHWESTGVDHKDYQVTLEDGRTFFVPAAKTQWRFGNPTGRDILFVGRGGTVYCFVPGSGT